MSRQSQNNHLLGAAVMIGAAACFAGTGALIKYTGSDLPNAMVVFFRNLFGLIFLLPWLLRLRRQGLATRHFYLHLIRVGAGLSAMYCYFYALVHLKLADAVLLNYSAPLFIPFIAALWLTEPVPKVVRLAIVTGFAGLLLVLKPTPGLFVPAAGIGLLSGVLAAIAMVSIRRMSATEPATRIVFYFCTLATVVSAIPLLWSWQTPTVRELGLLVGIGILATAGQLLVTRGYSLAPAAKVGPLTYTSVIFATLYGWIFWDEWPDSWSLLGMGMVIAAGVLALLPARARRLP